MSAFLGLADAIADRLTAAALVHLVAYGSPMAVPADVRSAITIEIGDSEQVTEYLGVNTWLTSVTVHCVGRVVPRVDRSPAHAAEAILSTVTPILRDGDAELIDALRPLGFLAFRDAKGGEGFDAYQLIRRDVLPGASPAGVCAITLYMLHEVTQSPSGYDPVPQP